MKYTSELLSEIVRKSKSLAEVLRTLGLKEAGGNYAHINKRIKEAGIDKSHFVKYTNFLQPGVNKKHWQEVLVLRTSGRRQEAVRLRKALIESGVEYGCNRCSIKEWNEKVLILEVNHKNNNWLDDRRENLEFICPNCHSQEKHKMNQGYTKLTVRKYRRDDKNGTVDQLAGVVTLKM